MAMSLELGDLLVSIRGENKSAKAAIKEATSDLSQLRRHAEQQLGAVERVWQSMGKGASAVVSPFRAVGGAIGAAINPLTSFTGKLMSSLAIFGLAANGLQTIARAATSLPDILFGGNRQMEDYTASFEVLLGSVDKAQTRMADLRKFAATTPFQLPEVVAGSVTLQALAPDLASGEGLKMVGNIAAQAKLINPETNFQEVANYVGRLRAGLQTGTPVGEALEQISRMGLISGGTRAKILADEMKPGHGDELWALVLKDFQKSNGLMAREMKTWDGIMSNVQDAWGALRREFGQPLFDMAKPALSTLMNWLGSDAAIAKAKGLGQAVGSGVNTAIRFLTSPQTIQGLKEAGGAIGTVLGFAWTRVTGTVGVAWRILQPVFEWLSRPEVAAGARQIGQAMNEGLGRGLDTVGQGGKWVLDNVIRPVWAYLTSDDGRIKIQQIGAALKDDVAGGWDAVKTSGTWVWENMLKPALDWMGRSDVQEGALKVGGAIKDTLAVGWQALSAIGGAFWTDVLLPFGNWLSDPNTVKGLSDFGQTLAKWLQEPLKFARDHAEALVIAFAGWKLAQLATDVAALGAGILTKLVPAMQAANAEAAGGAFAGGAGGAGAKAAAGGLALWGPIGLIAASIIGVGATAKETKDAQMSAEQQYWDMVGKSTKEQWENSKKTIMSLSREERENFFGVGEDVFGQWSDKQWADWLEKQRAKAVDDAKASVTAGAGTSSSGTWGEVATLSAMTIASSVMPVDAVTAELNRVGAWASTSWGAAVKGTIQDTLLKMPRIDVNEALNRVGGWSQKANQMGWWQTKAADRPVGPGER